MRPAGRRGGVMPPEAGDLDKPKLCFFFDEAHLEQLLRSSGSARRR
jgi:hypothetical protein